MPSSNHSVVTVLLLLFIVAVVAPKCTAFVMVPKSNNSIRKESGFTDLRLLAGTNSVRHQNDDLYHMNDHPTERPPQPGTTRRAAIAKELFQLVLPFLLLTSTLHPPPVHAAVMTSSSTTSTSLVLITSKVECQPEVAAELDSEMEDAYIKRSFFFANIHLLIAYIQISTLYFSKKWN